VKKVIRDLRKIRFMVTSCRSLAVLEFKEKATPRIPHSFILFTDSCSKLKSLLALLLPLQPPQANTFTPEIMC
jgi:hypothetical protein